MVGAQFGSIVAANSRKVAATKLAATTATSELSFTLIGRMFDF